MISKYKKKKPGPKPKFPQQKSIPVKNLPKKRGRSKKRKIYGMNKDKDEYGQDESDADSLSIQSAEKPCKKRKFLNKNKTLSIKTSFQKGDLFNKNPNAEDKKDEGQ